MALKFWNFGFEKVFRRTFEKKYKIYILGGRQKPYSYKGRKHIKISANQESSKITLMTRIKFQVFNQFLTHSISSKHANITTQKSSSENKLVILDWINFAIVCDVENQEAFLSPIENKFNFEKSFWNLISVTKFNIYSINTEIFLVV